MTDDERWMDHALAVADRGMAAGEMPPTDCGADAFAYWERTRDAGGSGPPRHR